jgi:hypothetical protein
LPVIGLRDVHGAEPGLGKRRSRFDREPLPLVHVGCMAKDLLVRQGSHGLADRHVLVVEDHD